jgi:FGGY-family pentulose kinase
LKSPIRLSSVEVQNKFISGKTGQNSFMAPTHVIGIDVGTGSARAGIFDLKGRMVGVSTRPIQIFKPQPDFVEQSSVDIWKSVCSAVKQAMRQAGLTHSQIAGISFDATASLVAMDANDQPVTVSPTGLDNQNIIVWMDHRAIPQANKLTEQADEVTRYLGGIVSPEHEIPKLMWLKKHQPAAWKRTARFFDLTDWLTYRATGRDVRSLCTTVCKWTYLGHETEDARWSRDFINKNGILEIVSKNRNF